MSLGSRSAFVNVITAKTEVCIPDLGYAPCNSRGMYFIPQSLQGAYPRYGIHPFLLCEEGLVDSTSPEDFNARLENCRDTWNTREAPYAPASGPRFYSYFVRYKAQEVCYSMRKVVREAAGLGSPPEIFTTNASESVNALMKRTVNYKESEWPAFNQEIMQLAKQQREEVVQSLFGQGQYRLLPQYSHFSVPATHG